MSSLALAIALIIDPDPDAVKEPDPALMLAVKQLALAWELMDAREEQWVLINPLELNSDLLLIRKRYEELKDAPPACDAVRFPGPDLCRELINQNREYSVFLKDRQLLGESLAGDWIREAIEEA